MENGSLRDQLSEQFEQVEKDQVAAEAPAEAVATETAAPAEAVETTEQKVGRTAGRARDEHGRLLPGAAKKESAAPTEANKPTPSAGPTSTVAAEPPKPLARPSTLKKELWPVWDKLAKGEALTPQEARQKAEWILQRDNDYAKGVSTYKGEAENARQYIEAVAPFLPALQANNIQPAQWIQNLGNAHQTLVYGSPQEKVAKFAQMAQQYGVDLGQMFVKGNDGQVYLNPQLTQAQQRPQQQGFSQADIAKQVDAALSTREAQREVERMKSDTEKYPHFDTVRQTMVGLLQSGLATDYDEAYHAAIRHPRHSDIFEAQQQQQRQAEADAKAEANRKAVDAARRNAVSPRSATPTAAAAGTNGKKGLRDTLSENFDAVSAGRV